MMHRTLQGRRSASRAVHGYVRAVRFASTAPRALTFRDFFKAPIVKSVVLTVFFGSAVVELIKQRRDLDSLRAAHRSKFALYEDVIDKLKRGEKVDLAQELRIAERLTKHRYRSVKDMKAEEQWDMMFEFDEPEEEVLVPVQTESERTLLKFL